MSSSHDLLKLMSSKNAYAILILETATTLTERKCRTSDMHGQALPSV